MTTLADPPAVARTAAGARSAGREHASRAYVALTKPRVIELLLVTTVPTMVLAARRPAVARPGRRDARSAARSRPRSANALNCWYDQDIDVLMHRTERRPLARHTVSSRAALVFGLVLGRPVVRRPRR